MKQVIVIHGGTTFSDYEDYLQYLRTKPVTIDRMRYQQSWKERLQEELGDEYNVLLPNMPNGTNARYSEWKLWFDNVASVITDGCVLVGHSLGGIFLIKYLSENQFPSKIAATALIAAPYDDESQEDLGDFKFDKVSKLFSSQAGKITFFFGTDDPVIASSEIKKYERDLPTANFRIMSASDHFVRPAFPELIEFIRSI